MVAGGIEAEFRKKGRSQEEAGERQPDNYFQDN
jgi:hypothetical protein